MRLSTLVATTAGILASSVLGATSASAATYQIGLDKPYRQPSEVIPMLAPGDIVEVDGDADYEGIWLELDSGLGGTAEAPIVWKGIRKDGKRPRIRGTVYDDSAFNLFIEVDYHTFDGFDISGGQAACVFHRGNGIVIRDTIIHGCPRHGLIGADDGSGSLTMSYCEVTDSGAEIEGENLKHPIYMATDEVVHPGSVFRLEHSWVHDNNGGNSVKTRAERNEIYYNWLEGAQFYNLEIIGPSTDTGLGPPREDADVVGNVILSHTVNYAVRLGSDGVGSTEGRMRLVNNTIIMGPDASGALRCDGGLETLEIYNNAFIRQTPWMQGAMGHEFFRDGECVWTNGRDLRGSNNFVTDSGDITLPEDEITGTVRGADPGFGDFANRDLRPLETSLLVNAGVAETTSDQSPPNPLARPLSVPPQWSLEVAGGAYPRDEVGLPDIGAYEFGSPTGEPGQGGNGGGESEGPDGGGGPGGDGGGGCGCNVGGRDTAPHAGLMLAVLGLALVRRRRR